MLRLFSLCCWSWYISLFVPPLCLLLSILLLQEVALLDEVIPPAILCLDLPVLPIVLFVIGFLALVVYITSSKNNFIWSNDIND